MKTISILNLKGGVAKTFTAANMAYELYRRGYCMSFHRWQRMQITHLWGGNISQYQCSMQAGLGMR